MRLKTKSATNEDNIPKKTTAMSTNCQEEEKVEENQPSASVSQGQHVFSPELLKMYYARLFPFDFMHTWFSYDPLGKEPQVFSRREFSFTIEPSPGQEIYIRYQSFNSEQELKDAIVKKNPRKIDIGAVFSHPPKDKNAVQNFTTKQRELVFDIDLTDYDEVRRCGCTGAKICPVCWEFMNMAVKVMDQGLRDDFGFEKIAWFYSGRRGVHAWVCDESARMLSNEARSAVANYFEVSLNKKNKESLPLPMHPMLARARNILEPMFVKSVLPASGHGLLASQESWEEFLDTLPNPARGTVGERMKKEWPKSNSSPEEKWEELKHHLKIVYGSTGQTKKTKNLEDKEKEAIQNWPTETIFKFTYPRLDINVSKMQNHLLKSPFCVHPKTGRVCVPIEVENVEEFDPFKVPTLDQLMRELDSFEDDGSGKKLKDWQKTSLKSYFEPFRKHFLDPLQMDLRRIAKSKAEELAAATADF